MWTRALDQFLFIMWRYPSRIITVAVLFCTTVVIAGAGASFLVKHGTVRRAGWVVGRRLALFLLLFCLADWALLRALPWLRLSFSTDIQLSLLASVLVRLLLSWGVAWAGLIARWRRDRRGESKPVRSAVTLFVVCSVLFTAVQVDAYVVEPLWVDTTQLSLSFDDLDPELPPVRVVHLSDAHIERSSYREAGVVKRVNALQPDIIVLTGDYLNLSRLSDPQSVADFRAFVSQLQAPYGIYAVRGSVEPTMASMARLVRGTEVVWLEQESATVNVRGQEVTLVGVACSHNQETDSARLDEAMRGVSDEAFTLLLYHSPDLIAEAAQQKVDLYVGGHTHGGQLRLPFYGAIVTGSIYGRRYVSGLFEEGDTRMYISRGVGFEGGGMPRARFLCRPEIVALELAGSTTP